MRKEAVLIVGAIVALLAAFGVVITPEQHEAIEAIVVLILPIAAAWYARSQVASKDSINREIGENAEHRLFPNDR